MSLIKCQDCGSEVSSIAPICPKCGRPFTQPERVQTIEKTSKKYKTWMLLSALSIFFGVMELPLGGSPAFAAWLIVGGIVGWIVARCMAWWNNG